MTAALVMQDPQLLVPDFTPEHTLFLDFETYWDKDFTLRKVTTAAYVRDPRFEVILASVYDGEDTQWFEEWEFREWVGQVDWSKVALGAHNAQFDAFILSERYDVHPAVIFDTQSMAMSFGIEGGVSLKNLAVHFSVGAKGEEVHQTQGKHRRDFTPEEWQRYVDYCVNDTVLCSRIFDAMIEKGFPEPELWVIDATMKAFTEPKLLLDEPLARQFLEDERARKKGLLDRIDKDKSIISSSEKFAKELMAVGIEPPMKLSPKTGKYIHAFAKNDAGMMGLLEHEQDEVRWLAEARVAIKSTQSETRAERFLKLGANGQRLPVQLKYCGAHTTRHSASGKTNFQNLERTNKKNPMKGVLKKALIAPFGYKVVAADSGAIEARTNAWLAGHETLLDGFRQKRDLYSEMASDIFSRKVDRKNNPEDEVPGGLGKVCLAGDTLVLTERGWVPITEVCQTDRVWDGIEWVNHSGLIDQGVRTVLRSRGVAATPDHEILTEHGWVEWSEVLTQNSLFQSALDSAYSLPNGGSTAGFARDGTPSCCVIADGRVPFTGAMCFAEQVPGATDAREKKLPSRSKNTTGSTATLCLKTGTVSGFSIASHLASLAATTLKIVRTVTTAAEEFLSPLNGEPTGVSFFSMSELSSAGMTLPSTWIERITTAGTNRETSDSFLTPRTLKTGDRFLKCNGGFSPSRPKTQISEYKTRTYDLACAGPRMRFCVLTEAGPILVHNCILGCGYQMGWAKFADTLLKGPMGNPPIKIDLQLATSMGVDINRFFTNERKVRRARKILSRLTDEELLIHCAASEKIVQTYRKTNEPIVELWSMMEKVILTMAEAAPGEEFSFGPGDCLTVVRHGIILPNGLMLRYPGLRESGVEKDDALVVPNEDDEEQWLSDKPNFSYLGQYGKVRKKIYGGLLTENIVQALARVILTDQSLHIKAVTGEDWKLFTHDELGYVEPEPEAPAFLELLLQTMRTTPKWAPGLPLAVEGGFHSSYGLAKG